MVGIKPSHMLDSQVDIIQSMGIKPGPIYGGLKAGKTIEFEGKILKPEEFLGEFNFN